jgi:hypothetical protein
MRHGHYRRLGSIYIAGAYVRHMRHFRAKGYQWEKVESFAEMCLRLECGA